MGKVIDDDDEFLDIEFLETVRETFGDELEEMQYLGAVRALSTLKNGDKRRIDRLSAFVPKKKRSSTGNSLHSHVNFFSSPRNYSEEQQNQDKDKKKKTTSSRKRRFEGDEDYSHSARKAKKKAKKTEHLGPPPPIPSELRAKIERKGGTDIKLVIMKTVTATDLNTSEARLSMPERQVNRFLKEGEENKLKIGMAVKLIEPCGYESEMRLRRWKYNKSCSFVLTTSWTAVLERNEGLNIFQVNNLIQVWCFRVDGLLWLAINKVSNGDEGEAISSPSSEVLD